jgi:CBS domain-containing protein
MSLVRDILKGKNNQVATIARDATVFEATMQMHQHHIGALLVMEGDEILGIFTERDLMNRVVAVRRDPDLTLVEDVMTDRVAFCEPDATIESCRTIMAKHRLRHLPVLEDGLLRGMISSGDILAGELHDQEETIRYMHEYMQGAC